MLSVHVAPVPNRLHIAAGRGFSDGVRKLRQFGAADVTSLLHLPHLSGDHWLVLAQWLPLALQDGHGVLSWQATEVHCRLEGF